jgi:hypothetical protein
MSHARPSTPVLAALAAAVLAGCSSGDSGDAAATKAQTTQAAAKPVAIKMVKASSPDDPGVPVAVTFDVRQKPVPGQPFEVALELTPTAEIAQFSARVEAMPGLDIRGGSNLPVVAQPAVGTPVPQLVTVAAAADGVYTLRVIVTGPPPSAGETGKSRTYFVPIIAGNGVAGFEPKPTDAAQAESAAAAGATSASPTGIPRRAVGQ